MTKQAIARTFGRAAASYDAAAHLQRRVADRLLEQTKDLPLPEQPTLADLGTGTGYCLPLLKGRYRPARLHALDLSPAMLDQARVREPQALTLQGDLEAMPFEDASHDLLTSSLAVQWLDQPRSFLNEACRVLKPGGYLVFSTLTQGTLSELREAWLAADNRPHVNDCLTLDQWREAATQSGLQIHTWEPEHIEVGYESPLLLLQELKRLGASHVKNGSGRINRATLQQMVRAYQAFQRPDGQYPASWRVLYVILRKEPA